MEQLLAEAQAALLVTNWEGFPLSILEAMRAGLPVVATAVAGIGESVRDDETGFLVPHGNVDVLRERIRRLLVDPGLRVRLGRNGRARFEQCFTLPTFVRNTLAVYQEVVGETNGRAVDGPRGFARVDGAPSSSSGQPSGKRP